MTGKVALVTGAGNGIGRGIAFECAAHGASIAVADCDEAAANGVAHAITAAGGNAQAFSFDLASPADCERLVQDVCIAYGGIHLLVNNASTWSNKPFWRPGEPGAESRVPDWEHVFRVNLTGTMHLSRLVAQRMQGNAIPEGSVARGAIVQITSIHQREVRLFHIEYALTKAAQAHLVKELAVLLAPYRIRVNGIAPGDIRTRPNEAVDAGQRIATKYVPFGQACGLPYEIARAVIFLASEYWSGYVTGTTITVDGGLCLYNHCVDLGDPGRPSAREEQDQSPGTS